MLLKFDIKSIGIDKFRKEIIATFETREEAYVCEESIVTIEYVRSCSGISSYNKQVPRLKNAIK